MSSVIKEANIESNQTSLLIMQCWQSKFNLFMIHAAIPFSKARKLVGRHTFKDFKQSGRQRRERSRSKMTLYSWSEFRNSWMCSTSLVAKHLSFSITYVSSARNLKKLLLRSLFSDHANFGDFTLLFCRARLRNVHTFKTHVLSYWSLR